MPTVSTSLRTTLTTAARKGINLHLAKSLGVAVRKSHLALPLPSSVKPKECSQTQQPHWQGDTVVISRAPRTWHKDCQEGDVVRKVMLSGICLCWSNAEQWHRESPAAAHSSDRAVLSWSQDLDPTHSAHRAWGRGLQTQPLRLWKSHRLLKTSSSFKLIQLDTAMPLKPAKISLIKAGPYSFAISIMLIHFRLCIHREFPS